MKTSKNLKDLILGAGVQEGLIISGKLCVFVSIFAMVLMHLEIEVRYSGQFHIEEFFSKIPSLLQVVLLESLCGLFIIVFPLAILPVIVGSATLALTIHQDLIKGKLQERSAKIKGALYGILFGLLITLFWVLFTFNRVDYNEVVTAILDPHSYDGVFVREFVIFPPFFSAISGYKLADHLYKLIKIEIVDNL